MASKWYSDELGEHEMAIKEIVSNLYRSAADIASSVVDLIYLVKSPTKTTSVKLTYEQSQTLAAWQQQVGPGDYTFIIRPSTLGMQIRVKHEATGSELD